MKRMLLALVVATAAAFPAAAQGLTLWTTLEGSGFEYLQQDVAKFSAAFGIPVDIVYVDVGEMKQTMLLAAPQGEGPDVLVNVPHDQVAEMALGGVLADMSTAATATYLADLSEQARLAFTFNGRLFGLPLAVEGPALVYNRDLMPEVPATYEELLEVAAGLTTADTYGFLHDINNFYFSYGWLKTFGGYTFGRGSGSLDAADVGLANDGAVAGAEALRNLRFGLGIVPSGVNYDVANGLFLDGALAMTYNGPWSIGDARNAGIDVAVAPMPPLADGTPWSGFMGVQGVLVNEFSGTKTDAFNLAKWVTRADGQLGFAALGRIPASSAALAQVSDDPILVGFGTALVHSEPMPNIPEMGQVWGPMGNALSIITGEESADSASVLSNAVDEIKGQ